MSALCIIPARAGSQRIPGKNFKPFLGRPILEYVIELAIECRLFGNIVISTDAETVPIAEAIAAPYGFGAPVVMVRERPARLCEDDVGTQEVTREVIKQVRWSGTYTCCIYPCAVLALPEDLIMGKTYLDMRQETPFVYPKIPGAGLVRNIRADPGQWYFGRTGAFLWQYELDGDMTRRLFLDERRCCDINTPEDWARAEALYKAMKGGSDD